MSLPAPSSVPGPLPRPAAARLKKKALQQAYDQAIKRKMVRCRPRAAPGPGMDSCRASPAVRGRTARPPACRPVLSLGLHARLCRPQEEEAAQRMGGRGLEEIAAEPVGRPEDSGALPGWAGRRCRVGVGGRRCRPATSMPSGCSPPPCCLPSRPPHRVAVYYHPTLNPMGIPPPGKPQK